MVTVGLADNPWVVWPTLALAAIAASGVIVEVIPTTWQWAKGHWGKFGLRWLDPDGVIEPKEEQQARLLHLLPGHTVVRFSLRPNISLSSVTRLSFSAFDNQWYPLRLWMGSTGKRVSSEKITAMRLRRHKGGPNWEDWLDIPGPVAEGKSVGVDHWFRFTHGSRQVFEVEYQVQESMAGWDGTLGVEVTYEASGNNDHAYVNSKACVRGSGRRTPITFGNRRVNTSKVVKQSSPDMATFLR
jgi:hypothetical protein